MYEILSILCVHWMRDTQVQCHFNSMLGLNARNWKVVCLFFVVMANIYPINSNGNFFIFSKIIQHKYVCMIIRCDCMNGHSQTMTISSHMQKLISVRFFEEITFYFRLFLLRFRINAHGNHGWHDDTHSFVYNLWIQTKEEEKEEIYGLIVTKWLNFVVIFDVFFFVSPKINSSHICAHNDQVIINVILVYTKRRKCISWPLWLTRKTFTFSAIFLPFSASFFFFSLFCSCHFVSVFEHCNKAPILLPRIW